MQTTTKKIVFFLLTFLPAAFAESQVSFKGDFRFRTENIREEQVSPLSEAERTRQRLRVRLGATGKVNEKSDVIVRFATGTTAAADSTTTNQDLTDHSSKKGVVLDLAYFDHKASENIQILGGKTPQYFWAAGGSDLIFDADLTPEGLALKYKTVNETNEIYFNTGMSWLAERFSATGATDNTDVGLVGAQVGGLLKFEDFNLLLAFSAYNFSNIKGSTAASAKGNTLTTGAYTNDYKLTALDTEVSFKLLDLPFAVFYQMVTNSDPSNYKNGGLVGLKIGKAKDVNSWAFSIDHRELEKDAVVGILSESDSSGGGTDIRSTRLAAIYQAAENANVALTVLSGKKNISSTVFSANYLRSTLDFNFSF